ncbi:hypothetical protein MaudCBS49596_006868 [Microsporum audouinii]
MDELVPKIMQPAFNLEGGRIVLEIASADAVDVVAETFPGFSSKDVEKDWEPTGIWLTLAKVRPQTIPDHSCSTTITGSILILIHSTQSGCGLLCKASSWFAVSGIAEKSTGAAGTVAGRKGFAKALIVDSYWPDGCLRQLGEEQLDDLLTFAKIIKRPYIDES